MPAEFLLTAARGDEYDLQVGVDSFSGLAVISSNSFCSGARNSRRSLSKRALSCLPESRWMRAIFVMVFSRTFAFNATVRILP